MNKKIPPSPPPRFPGSDFDLPSRCFSTLPSPPTSEKRPASVSGTIRHKVIGSLFVGWGAGEHYFLGFKGAVSATLDKKQALELAQDLIEYGKS